MLSRKLTGKESYSRRCKRNEAGWICNLQNRPLSKVPWSTDTSRNASQISNPAVRIPNRKVAGSTSSRVSTIGTVVDCHLSPWTFIGRNDRPNDEAGLAGRAGSKHMLLRNCRFSDRQQHSSVAWSVEIGDGES